MPDTPSIRVVRRWLALQGSEGYARCTALMGAPMAEPERQEAGALGPESVRPGALSALLQELVGRGAESDLSTWDQALRAGAVIGRFELVREVGRGGFGVVWEARDRELKRTVAFKALKAHGPPFREERLLQEAE